MLPTTDNANEPNRLPGGAAGAIIGWLPLEAGSQRRYTLNPIERIMETNLLIFNCGSSSLSYKVYRLAAQGQPEEIATGKAYHVGTKSQEESYLQYKAGGHSEKEVKPLPNHREAARAILQYLQHIDLPVQVIGHRFVHGGTQFAESAWITPESLPRLEQCSPLAPIHNPNSLSVIHLCQEMLPQALQFAAFDTAFHAGLPEKAYRYALPTALADQFGFRKYGFHGLSYQYVSLQASRFLQAPLETLKIVACHLGTGGSSVAAIQGGRSLDTSMGYSPLPGLVMSTRCGDLDPAVVLELIGERGYSVEAVNRLLNKDSGLVGISGYSSDLFELIQRMEEPGGEKARLAVEMYVHRLKSYIGAYLAILGGADALVFTDDIGVRAWQVRARACARMEWCGIRLDEDANRRALANQIALVSQADSPVKVLSIPTDEEAVIALDGARLLQQRTH